jgi:hypothetical protein
MIESKPKFLNGIYTFQGVGYDKAGPFSDKLVYSVPSDKRAQLIYFRGGSSCVEMVCVILMRDGQSMRYFPIAAKGTEHVPLAVVEDLEPDTKLELFVAAPVGSSGTLVIDVGLLEI